MTPLVVVKFGGSLMTGGDVAGLVDQVLAAPARIVIVPGGGRFADAVRDAQGRLGFSDALAHRLAIDAMGHFAEVLRELRPSSALAGDAEAVRAAHAAGRTAIWTARSVRDGHPDIPESWEVTSDSLAAHFAAELGADALVLVKSAEPPGDQVADLVAAGHIDAAFPAFLARLSAIVRILGPADHGRLGAVVADPAAAIGTRVQGGASWARMS